ncbi:MAG: stage III sporulation protein AB [Lachnospiraceae bacterium]|nr:stage III sporulation protein AB [Lachnospiraceae bacterium]
MVKILGILMILLGAAGTGLKYSNEIREYIESLQELRRMIEYIKGEINYRNCSLAEAFHGVEKKVKKPYNQFCRGIYQQIEDGTGCSFSEIFMRCIQKELNHVLLKNDDKEQLGLIGEQLGYLDKEMQIHNLEHYGMELEDKISRLKKESKDKMKLCNCLGIVGGLFLIIILL